MNHKAILFYLGLFIFPLSGLSLLNILYSTYFDYFLNIQSYTITFFLTLGVGTFFCFYGKNSIKKISFYEQLLLIILVYLISSSVDSTSDTFSYVSSSFSSSSFSSLSLSSFSLSSS